MRVERQEAFFMRYAAEEIEKILAENTGAFSPARQTLMELLHPAHLGAKFQMLTGPSEMNHFNESLFYCQPRAIW